MPYLCLSCSWKSSCRHLHLIGLTLRADLRRDTVQLAPQELLLLLVFLQENLSFQDFPGGPLPLSVLRQLPDLHALSIPRHNLQGARAAGRNVPRYALGGLGSCPECLGWQSNRCGTVKQNEQSPDLVQISFANRGLALTHRLQE